MKQLSIGLLLLTVIVGGCKKSSGSPEIATPPRSAYIPPPTANFKITSTLSYGTNNVLEGQTMVFDNSSQNSDSYYWDFGNGTYSTEKIPSDITLWPCQTTITVKLTVRNKAGLANIYSEPYNVICYKTWNGGTSTIGRVMPAGWPKH